jgi:hypothetical protein
LCLSPWRETTPVYTTDYAVRPNVLATMEEETHPLTGCRNQPTTNNQGVPVWGAL